MAWFVLALWWVVFPAVPEWDGLRWFVHLGAVALLGLVRLPAVWRGGPVRLSLPVVCTLLALGSLAVAVHVTPERFAPGARWWGGLTGLAHGLLFLIAFALVPARGEGLMEYIQYIQ